MALRTIQTEHSPDGISLTPRSPAIGNTALGEALPDGVTFQNHFHSGKPFTPDTSTDADEPGDSDDHIGASPEPTGTGQKRRAHRLITALWNGLLLIMAIALCLWQVRHTTTAAHVSAPAWLCLPVMVGYHLCALPVTLGIIRGCSLTRMATVLVRWVWVGFGVVALGQPAALPAALMTAFTVTVVIGRAARYETNLQEGSLRAAFRSTLLITVWGLQILLAASLVQLTGQLVPWLIAWLLVLNPRMRNLVSHVWDILEHRQPGGQSYERLIRTGWALSLVCITGAMAACIHSHRQTSSISLGHMVIQPYAGAISAALIAIGLRLSASNRLLRGDWIYGGALLGGFAFIRELGSPGIFLIATTALVFVVTGTRRDFRRLLLLLIVLGGGVFALCSFTPTSDTPGEQLIAGVQSHLSHVRRRLDYLEGQSNLEELNRIDLAVSAPGALGRGGWARTWILSRAAPKDYALAALLLSFGWLGLLHVLLLYAVLFGALISFCLMGKGYASARYVCLAITLGFVTQTIVPIGGSVNLLIAVGVPLLGIARGGAELVIFIMSWLVLSGAEKPVESADTAIPVQSYPIDQDYIEAVA